MQFLTHWGWVTHLCITRLTIIGSDNGLSPGRRQAIIWTNVSILLIGPLETNFNEMFIEMLAFSFAKIHLQMSSGKWRPFCLGLNVLIGRVSTETIPHGVYWVMLGVAFTWVRKLISVLMKYVQTQSLWLPCYLVIGSEGLFGVIGEIWAFD